MEIGKIIWFETESLFNDLRGKKQDIVGGKVKKFIAMGFIYTVEKRWVNTIL